jgi:RHS repeat-associated protein
MSGENDNGANYYYIRNGQNDIIGILDSTGTQVVSYQYDTWGKLLGISGSQASTVGTLNPFRYRGYYYDTETGLYYLNSRYYDPITCRMLNADSITSAGGDLLVANVFAYCGNNPVSEVKNIIAKGFLLNLMR